jgi:hypothetical protein
LGRSPPQRRRAVLPGFTADTLRKIILQRSPGPARCRFIQHVAATYPGIDGKLMLGMAFAPREVVMLQELAGLVASTNAGKQAGFYADRRLAW